MDPAALQVLHHGLERRRSGSLDTVQLPGADLRGAQLLRADLVGADLAAAALEHAQLAGAKLGGARLAGGLLAHADLAGADLTGADLRGADLSFARLEGAVLAGADLRGAKVGGAVGEPASLAGVLIDRAMCLASDLSDDAIVRLWSGGAIIDDLEHFDSLMIRAACATPSDDVASDIGPSTRRLSDIEVEAQKQRLAEDDEMPPSARMSVEAVRLLVTTPEDGAPMSMRALKLVVPVLTPDIVRAPAWGAGDSVLGVELTSLIGQGSAAQVWAGRDADGDTVAVKLFKAYRASVGLTLPAFRRGVSVMNRLTEPDASTGVVQLRAVSLNRLGMVMDHAANGSAADLPALGWNVKSAVAFFMELCRTVAHAHAAGALHRCLKPSNVLLDADLKPLLTDFDMVDLPTLAAESRNIGGYADFAAPEELLGHGTQSPTADIYSLGRFLHFLLLGDTPAAAVGPVPALEELRSQPAGLVRIIRKCTARAPEARYQQVDELLEDVGRYDDFESVGLAGGPEGNFLPYRVSSLSHRTPWLGQKPSAPAAKRGSLHPSQAPRRASNRPLRASPPRESGRPARATDPLGLSPNAEKLIGTLGLLAVLVSMVAVMTSAAPTSAWLAQLRILSAVGGMLATLWMGRAKQHALVWRLVWMAIGGGALFAADLPGLAAPGGTSSPAPISAPSSPPVR